MATIVDRVIALRHYEAKNCGVAIETRVPEGLPELSVDVPAIERALMYLVANALDAVSDSEDKQIWIDGASTNGVVTICVRDSADSVSEVDRIFEPLFTTKGGHHLGIGLCAARLTAESSGGTLTYESGRGFCLSLPIA
jgi:C4-dicarboxylate-specific signal transduction histidine kinase